MKVTKEELGSEAVKPDLVKTIGQAAKQPNIFEQVNTTLNNIRDIGKLFIQLRNPGVSDNVVNTEAEAPPLQIGEVATVKGKAPVAKEPNIQYVKQPPASLASVAKELYQVLNTLGLADKPIGELIDLVKGFSVNQLIKGGLDARPKQ